MTFTKAFAAAVLGLAALVGGARAEVGEIRAAQQYGLSYLPLMIMEDRKLIEKHAKAAGLGDLKASWVKLGGPGPMNDALLSGQLDFGTGGVPSLITLWSKTKGTAIEVRGVGALNDMPVELVTTNPDVKTIADFSEKDRGPDHQGVDAGPLAADGRRQGVRREPLRRARFPHRLARSSGCDDHAPVGQRRHLGAFLLAALPVSGKGEAGRASSRQQLRDPGRPGDLQRRMDDGALPRRQSQSLRGFVEALEEAVEIINRDKTAAAEAYKRMTGTKETVEELHAMLADPDVSMTLTPHRLMTTAVFMHKVGRIKAAPSAWTDLFFPNVHDLPGS